MAAAQAERGAHMESYGLHSLEPEAGLEALGRVLTAGATQIGVIPADVRKWLGLLPDPVQLLLIAIFPRRSGFPGRKAPRPRDITWCWQGIRIFATSSRTNNCSGTAFATGT